MAKLFLYPELSGTPNNTDLIPVYNDGQVKNVQTQNLIREQTITIGPAGSLSTYVCTGTADDVQIQAAITSLGSAGGVIYFRPGTYAISASISVTVPIIFKGCGKNTIIQASAAFSNGMFNINGQPTILSHIEFQDMFFDSNDKAGVQGITIRGGEYADGDSTDRVRIKRCRFDNLATSDVGHITILSGRGSIDRGPVSDVLVEDCQFLGTVKYHLYLNGGQVEKLRITRCSFKNSDGGCIAFNQPIKLNNSLAAYRSHKNWEIDHCYFTNNMLSGSFTSVGYIQDSNRSGVRSLRIHDNFFDGQATTQEQYCIQTHSTWGLEIRDNIFWNTRTIMAIGASANGDYFQTIPDNMSKIIGNLFYKAYNIADHDSSIFAIWEDNVFYEIEYAGGSGGTSRQWPSHYKNNFFYNTPTTLVGESSQKASFNTSSSGHLVSGNTFVDDRLLASPTTAPTLTTVSGGSMGSRTYFVKYTYANDSGETLASSESTTTVGANQLLKATIPYSSTYGVPTGAKKVNWYISTTTGNETLQDYTPTSWQTEIETDHIIGATISFTEPTTGLVSGASPPTANTTNPLSIFGVYELSSVGPAHELPNHFINNRFYGIPVPFWKDSDNKRVLRDNFTNGALIGLRTTTDASMSNGGTTLTSSSAGFVAGDVGKTVIVMPFGGTSTSQTLYTTVSSFTSSTQVTLADPAPQAFSSALLAYGTASTIGKDSERSLEAEPYVQGNVTGSTTFNVNNGEYITFTLVGNITTILSSGHWVGQEIILEATQDETGSRTMSKPSNALLAGGAFSPTSTAGSKSRWILKWDATNWIERSRVLNMS